MRGKGIFYNRHKWRRRDHPRLCGEKPNAQRQAVLNLGSPPPMRGKDPELCLEHQSIGITPAYAGKSLAAG